MKKIYLIILALMPAILWAQPTITNMYNMPIGATYTMKNDSTAGVSSGGTGAGQLWNYGSLIPTVPTTNYTYTSLNPATASYIDSFPNANMVISNPGGQITYYTHTASNDNLIGLYSPSGPLFIYYQNGEQETQRPITFNNTYLDNFARHYSIGGYMTNGSGTLTVLADGYGTVITPAGTYPNCLKIKGHQTNVDTFLLTTTITTTNIWTYTWYNNNTFAPLFQIDSIVSSTTTTYDAMHLVSSSAGIEEVTADKSIGIIFPNPNAGEFTFCYHLNSATAILQIKDATGRLVYSENLAGSLGNASINSKNFYTPSVGGIYFWELMTNEGVQSRGKVSIVK